MTKQLTLTGTEKSDVTEIILSEKLDKSIHQSVDTKNFTLVSDTKELFKQ